MSNLYKTLPLATLTWEKRKEVKVHRNNLQQAKKIILSV